MFLPGSLSDVTGIYVANAATEPDPRPREGTAHVRGTNSGFPVHDQQGYNFAVRNMRFKYYIF